MKSLSSMKNGKFHPSKYRGKVPKTEEEILEGLFSEPPYFCCPPFWVDVVKSFWLAPAHARLA
jgi:hypothetical protein